ncbi:MAG: InlB B-repeat-containing protein, partial [Clostridia bacterium]|nr:InlB B-repeat-containing protein [Clostridia bacterium]
MKKRKLVGLLLAALTLFSALTVGVSALTWVGSSQGGTSGATSTSTGGYAIRTSGDNVVGYRFSVVNASGSATGNVIDVFRNTSNGNSAYSSNYKISTKRNKTGWIANQNANVTTTLTTAGCYKESTIGFYAALPSPDGMGKWQEDKRNLDPILEIISKKELTKALLESNPAYAGYKVLVEPIYEVKLEDVYHALTVTELAIYGKYLLGASSDGGSSYTSGSWGFISNYTNMYYPNELFTPNGMGLWTNANGLTSRTTFYTIINSGYGVGIAYANTKKPDTNYTIMFNGNGAESGFTPSMSMKNTESANLEKNGFIRKGYKFDGWATSSGGGVVFTEGQSVNKTILTGKGLTVNNGSTVTLYAHWTPYKMTFRYNANGGSVESNTFKVYSTASTALQLIAYKSNSYVYSYEVDYSSTAAYTVRTPESFGLSRTGYTFRDWAK